MELSLFWSIGLTLFVSTIVVRVAGFGGSLTSMPLLVPLVGLPVAAPIMTLFGITNFGIVIWQQWRDVTLRDIWRLAIASIIMTPFGIYLIYIVSESTMKLSLGLICITFALYRLSKRPFPRLTHPNWAWLFGIIAGLASGAFSVGGVPSVIYANTQDWEPEPFRLNMFSFFLTTGVFSLISRYFLGQLTGEVIQHWFFALPFLFAGLFVGTHIAKRVNRQQFQRLVLVMLIILGGRLVLSAL